MKSQAFTLLALIYALAIAGILLTLAVPGLRHILLEARQVADVNAFVRAIQMARSEAYKRGRAAIVCKTADRIHCGDQTIHYGNGWMVFVNEGASSPPIRNAGERLLYSYVPSEGSHITSNRRLFEFRPFRRHSTNGTVTFCDPRGPADAIAVVVSYTGRPRISRSGPGGRTLICAD